LAILSDKKEELVNTIFEFGLDVVRLEQNVVDPEDEPDKAHVKKDIKASILDAINLC